MSTTHPAAEAATRPVVGIVGAGQLARMTIEAAIPLGIEVRLLAARADDSAARIATRVAIGAADSPAALDALADACTVLTFDHELVDVQQLRRLEAAGHRLYPSSATVAIAQDKLVQRTVFGGCGLPVPPFRRLCSVQDAVTVGEEWGWPVVVKAVRGGYDGRGVWVARDPASAAALIAPLLASGLPLLVEQFVAIERELAVLVARRPGGETVVYPPAETVQRDGICHEVIAPARIPAQVAEQARCLALATADATGVTGIMAVELFQTADGLVLNEIATRPHNSGHLTIEACTTSQFENHLRAILDWPLGPPELIAPAAVMVNVIGNEGSGEILHRLPAALAVAGVHIHLYEKQPRPGRKLGHVTALGLDPAEASGRARLAAAILLGAAAEPAR